MNETTHSVRRTLMDRITPIGSRSAHDVTTYSVVRLISLSNQGDSEGLTFGRVAARLSSHDVLNASWFKSRFSFNLSRLIFSSRLRTEVIQSPVRLGTSLSCLSLLTRANTDGGRSPAQVVYPPFKRSIESSSRNFATCHSPLNRTIDSGPLSCSGTGSNRHRASRVSR